MVIAVKIPLSKTHIEQSKDDEQFTVSLICLFASGGNTPYRSTPSMVLAQVKESANKYLDLNLFNQEKQLA